MKYILALIGIVLSFYIIKFRESIGNSFGEADWMKYVGGIHNVIVIIAILLFFWCIATITGTEDIFFSPILWIIPGQHQTAAPAVNTLY